MALIFPQNPILGDTITTTLGVLTYDGIGWIPQQFELDTLEAILVNGVDLPVINKKSNILLKTVGGIAVEGTGNIPFPVTPPQYTYKQYKSKLTYNGIWIEIPHSTYLNNKIVKVRSAYVKTGLGNVELDLMINYPSSLTYNGSLLNKFYIVDKKGLLEKDSTFEYLNFEYDIINDTTFKYNNKDLIHGNNVISSHFSTDAQHAMQMFAAFYGTYPNFEYKYIESYADPLTGNNRPSNQFQPEYLALKDADMVLRPYLNGATNEDTGSNPDVIEIGSHYDNDINSQYIRRDITADENTFLLNTIAVGARGNNVVAQTGTSYGFGVEFFEDTTTTTLLAEYPERNTPNMFAWGDIDVTGLIFTPDLAHYTYIREKVLAGDTVFKNTDLNGYNQIYNPLSTFNSVVEVFEDNNVPKIRLENPMVTGRTALWQFAPMAYFCGSVNSQQSPAVHIVGAKLKKIKLATNVNWQLVREAARATANLANNTSTLSVALPSGSTTAIYLSGNDVTSKFPSVIATDKVVGIAKIGNQYFSFKSIGYNGTNYYLNGTAQTLTFSSTQPIGTTVTLVWDMYRGFGKIDTGAAIQYIADTYENNQDYLIKEAEFLEVTRGINQFLKHDDLLNNSPVSKKILDEYSLPIVPSVGDIVELKEVLAITTYEESGLGNEDENIVFTGELSSIDLNFDDAKAYALSIGCELPAYNYYIVLKNNNLLEAEAVYWCIDEEGSNARTFSFDTEGNLVDGLELKTNTCLFASLKLFYYKRYNWVNKVTEISVGENLSIDNTNPQYPVISFTGSVGSNPGGNNTELQFNDNGVFGASTGLTFDNGTPKLLTLIGNFKLPNTTYIGQKGIIYKNNQPFIHDFSYGLNVSGVTPIGKNIFIGESVGNFTMGATATSASSSSRNVGIGSESLLYNTTGSDNVAIGYNALKNNTEGSSNIAIGIKALRMSEGNSDLSAIAIGSLSLGDSQFPFNAIAIGSNAGRSASSVNSIFLGQRAGEYTVGTKNINIGSSGILSSNFQYINETIVIGSDSCSNLGDSFSVIYIIAGRKYRIIDSGNTDFIVAGAVNNYSGTEFISTSSSVTGTGIVQYVSMDSIIIGHESISNVGTGSGLKNTIAIGCDLELYSGYSENNILIGVDLALDKNNTVQIGNNNITDNYFNGNLHITKSLYVDENIILHTNKSVKFEGNDNDTFEIISPSSSLIEELHIGVVGAPAIIIDENRDTQLCGNLKLNKGTDTETKISLYDDGSETAYISQDYGVTGELTIYSTSGIKIGDTGKSLKLNQFTIPANDGTSGYVLATNGAGQLSFIAPPTGTANNAAGNAKEIQFRGASSGEFAASAALTWDNTAKLLTVNGKLKIGPTTLPTQKTNGTLEYNGKNAYITTNGIRSRIDYRLGIVPREGEYYDGRMVYMYQHPDIYGESNGRYSNIICRDIMYNSIDNNYAFFSNHVTTNDLDFATVSIYAKLFNEAEVGDGIGYWTGVEIDNDYAQIITFDAYGNYTLSNVLKTTNQYAEIVKTYELEEYDWSNKVTGILEGYGITVDNTISKYPVIKLYNNYNPSVLSIINNIAQWDIDVYLNAKVYVKSNFTLNLSIGSFNIGKSGNITLFRETGYSGAFTVTLTGYNNIFISTEISSTSNTFILPSDSNIAILSWYYDGTYIYINGTKKYI